MLTLSSELLLSVFAHVDHAKLDLLLRTSRTLREIARRQIAQRCRLARSVFETCAQELRKRVGSTRGECNACLRASFEGWCIGKLAVDMDVRMRVVLTQDRVRITVDEVWDVHVWDVHGVIIGSEYTPYRSDEFIVWPSENRMERDLNGNREPAIPMPEELADYLCAISMHPTEDNTEDMEIVCVTNRVYGRN
jgi:hypothetical protein